MQGLPHADCNSTNQLISYKRMCVWAYQARMETDCLYPQWNYSFSFSTELFNLKNGMAIIITLSPVYPHILGFLLHNLMVPPTQFCHHHYCHCCYTKEDTKIQRPQRTLWNHVDKEILKVRSSPRQSEWDVDIQPQEQTSQWSPSSPSSQIKHIYSGLVYCF